MTKLGANIRAKRLEKGWTLAQCAHHAGLSPSHLGRLETQYANPEVETLKCLAAVFDCEIGELLSEDVPQVHAHARSACAAHAAMVVFETLDPETKRALTKIIRKLARE